MVQPGTTRQALKEIKINCLTVIATPQPLLGIIASTRRPIASTRIKRVVTQVVTYVATQIATQVATQVATEVATQVVTNARAASMLTRLESSRPSFRTGQGGVLSLPGFFL